MINNLPKKIKNKLNRLKNIIKQMDSVIVAYSGGVDSSLLLKICKDILGNKVLAVIGSSEIYPKREIKFAINMAEKLNVPYLLIKTNQIKDKKFIRNFSDRCYWCKKGLFSKIKKIAEKRKISYILDGSNYDDLFDLRAGFKAAKELNIRKPLLEVKLTKEEIRKISKSIGLKTWNKPSFACLASRFPYKTKIDIATLRKINSIEEYILKVGIEQVRLRHLNKVAKIDILEKDFKRLINNKEKIIRYIKQKGYNFVVLDLEGYKQGSLNRV